MVTTDSVSLRNSPVHRHTSRVDGKPPGSINVALETRPSRLAQPDSEASFTIHQSTSDSFHLSKYIKSGSDIARLKANTSSKRQPGCSSLGKSQATKVADFYETQNEQITRLLKPAHEHVREAKETHESKRLEYRIAVYGSFVANVILSGLQLYGAISSGSLSLFTTMVDSVFDPFSNVTLMICNRIAAKGSTRDYPAGRARVETAGNIFFSFIMISVSMILVAFSCQELAEGNDPSFHLPSVIAVGIAFGTKLLLFLYCWALRNQYSQVRILWEDHRNDLFINGFGILTSVGGSKLKWWIDPMGAIILSLLIITLWTRTGYEQFQLLVGKTAEPATLQLITYVTMMHSDRFKAVDTVRAWHSGPRLIVEVDVVMEAEERMSVCHDVAEELQVKLESLPEVERAYVHVDFETSHRPEHESKKDL